MRKRPSSEPPIIPATGGGAGDEHHVVSDSTVTPKSHYDFFEPGFPCIPFDNPVEALNTDIDNFEKDPRVFDTLEMFVHSDKEVMELWFNELRAKWNQSPPTTPEEATRVVFLVLKKIYGPVIEYMHLQGMLTRYGLPGWRESLQPGDWGVGLPKPRPVSERLESLKYFIQELQEKEMEDAEIEMMKKQKQMEDAEKEMKKKLNP